MSIYFKGNKVGNTVAVGGSSNLQSKSITITSNGVTTVFPDNGYAGLSNVEITTNISGGTTKYVHHIYITWNDGQSHDGFFDCSILIINDNPNNFTQSTLFQFLLDNGFVTYPAIHNYPCFGSRVIDYQNVWNAIGITAQIGTVISGYELVITYEQNGQTTSLGIVPDNPGTLTDTVEQIN